MPGVYLGAILFSLAGTIAIDLKVGLSLRTAPRRTVLAVTLGTLFFLLWDAVGIVTGVFVKGSSPLFVGVDLAPHLPLEEVFFLIFLNYLAIMLWTVFRRLEQRRDATNPADTTARGSAS